MIWDGEARWRDRKGEQLLSGGKNEEKVGGRIEFDNEEERKGNRQGKDMVYRTANWDGCAVEQQPG
jgi:hypothetical protein